MERAWKRWERSGFYWCNHCRRQTELLDNDNGLAGDRCARCHSNRVEFREVDLPRTRPGSRAQHERVRQVTTERAAELFAELRRAAA